MTVVAVMRNLLPLASCWSPSSQHCLQPSAAMCDQFGTGITFANVAGALLAAGDQYAAIGGGVKERKIVRSGIG